MKNIYSNLLRLLAGLLIIILLFYKIGFADILNVLKLIKPFLLLPGFFFFILAWFISTLNLYILLQPQRLKIGVFRLFKYYFISKAVSLIFPGHLGEFSIIFLLKKRGLSLGDGGAIIFLDKLITVAISTLFAIAGFYFFFDINVTLKVTLVLSIIFISLVFLLTKRVRLFIRRFILKKYSNKFNGFSITFFSYFNKHKGLLFFDVLITIIRIFCNIVASFFVFLALGQFISIWILLVVGCMETVITLIPITFNGLGTRQLTGIYILSNLVGIDSSIVAAKYVIYLIFNYGIGLLTFAFLKRLK